MNIKEKLKKLKIIYSLYEEIEENSSNACKKGCGTCCTVNVCLTTLEYAYIETSLTENELLKDPRLYRKIQENLGGKRFTPKFTLNNYAKYILERKEPPEEDNNPEWGKCPFLIENLCSIYDVRPFACRCMSSATVCKKNGYANMDEFNLSLSNALIQYVEHLDCNGFTANLSDMIYLLADKKIDLNNEETRKMLIDSKFIQNTEIPLLLVPPEHQIEVGAILKRIE